MTDAPRNEWERRYRASLSDARGGVITPDGREMLVTVGRRAAPDAFSPSPAGLVVMAALWLIWLVRGRPWNVTVCEHREGRSPKRLVVLRAATRDVADARAAMVRRSLARDGIEAVERRRRRRR